MSEEGFGSNKGFKNSLLSAAATGFSFEDSAALLVPVSLQDEPTVEPEAISEIDLNSDGQDFGADALVLDNTVNFMTTTNESAVPHVNIFGREDPEKDAFSELLTSANTNKPMERHSPSFPTTESKGTEPSFLSSLWSSTGRWSSSASDTVPTQPPILETNPVFSGEAHNTGIFTGVNTNTNQLFSTSSSTMNPMCPPVFTPTIVSLSSGDSGITGTSGAFQPVSQPPMAMGAMLPPNGPALPPSGPAVPPSGPALPPASTGNSFRLGSQRPVYAKYPGLLGSNPTSPPVAPLDTVYGEVPNQPQRSYENTFTPLPIPFTASAADPTTPFNQSILTTGPGAYDGQINYSTPTMNYASNPFQVQPSRSPTMQQGPSKPLSFHWFSKKDVDGRCAWRPFSITDSIALENSYINQTAELVATDGGRYDTDVTKRQKFPVYWEENPSDVRRCSWFYKGPMDSRFVPYEEDLSERLEMEYQQAISTGVWNRRLEFPGGEAIILYNPTAMSHFCQAAAPDEWGNLPESQLRPRVVKRGVDEFEIEDGESTQIDHIVFLVHGIGAICDFKFRTIVEAVDDFRHLSFQLMQNHFKEAVDSQRAGRIEFLPISWHKALHGDGGIDQKLKPITLKSIPRLRNFTNDTLLDILFYTSPVYAQAIVDTVGNELNRLFDLFLTRNPTFNGHVALSGHSLGSLILFDLLAHQPQSDRVTQEANADAGTESASADTLNGANPVDSTTSIDSTSRMVSYTVGSGTGQPFIKFPTLKFQPTAFFALGSPIAMFATVRGIDTLGEEFHFPTCPAFFNIFHPYDPVAYRIETLIDPTCDMRPVLIPHHKGRKRFHLELKETMQRVGTDLKQKFLESMKSTWNTVYQYATFSKGAYLEQEIDRVIEGELGKKSLETTSTGSGEDVDEVIGLGKLNGGRRIDYVLQEAPLESFNEYLFALSSHVCYWESDDTMLMIMREIYASMGIFEVKAPTQPQVLLPASKTFDNVAMYQPATPPLFGMKGASSSGNISDWRSSQIPQDPVPLTENYMQAPATYAQPPPPLFMNLEHANNAQNLTNPPSTAYLPSAPPLDAWKQPTVIGARPVISPEALASLRGMDPTAPMHSATTIGPPPLTGFKRN